MIFGHITNKSLAKIYRLVVLKLVDMEDSVTHTYFKSIKSIFNFFFGRWSRGPSWIDESKSNSS